MGSTTSNLAHIPSPKDTSTINRKLPPEVVSMIFRELASIHPPGMIPCDLPGRQHKFDCGFMGVMHVCRYWREIARNDLSLWARIDFNKLSPAWYIGLISRLEASQVPVSVVATPDRAALLKGPDKAPEVSSELVDCILSPDVTRRLRSLLASTWPPYLRLFDRFMELQCPLPLMERLLLAAGSLHWEIRPSIALSEERFPLVKSLQLTGIPLDWRRSQLKNIVTLVVEHPAYKDVNPPQPLQSFVGLDTILPALATMVKLESLVLTHVLQPISEPAHENMTRIGLPRLVYFSVAGYRSDWDHLLSRLFMPSLKDLSISQRRPSPHTCGRTLYYSAPILERLILVGVPLDWSLPLPPRLWALSIKQRGYPGYPGWTLPAVYSPFLSVMWEALLTVKLRILKLIDAVDNVFTVQGGISQPSLEQLVITGTTNRCVDVSNSLNVEPNCCRSIILHQSPNNLFLDLESPYPDNFHNGTLTDGAPFDVLPVLYHRLAPFHTGEPPRGMFLRCIFAGGRYTNVLHLWAELKGPPELKLEALRTAQPIMSTGTWTLTSVHEIEVLFLDTKLSDDLPAWYLKRSLSGAVAVHTLILLEMWDDGATQIIQALHPSADAADPGILFPHLEELYLPFGDPDIDALCECLDARRRAGHPVREVRIPEPADWIPRLASVSDVRIRPARIRIPPRVANVVDGKLIM
ncbi:hypothetical protein FA95DRAFT_1608794 [Auriscalpium vulgare]|uniref:Uncharacterized protein n=1 Tax=Auriscalpium vulgare TaxID=40419 RepID=A0ACB8RKJ0_9AGAM|nr:hypothetical protein FA95DRAFT_1608794 [Auriscalpium vulgare]